MEEKKSSNKGKGKTSQIALKSTPLSAKTEWPYGQPDQFKPAVCRTRGMLPLTDRNRPFWSQPEKWAPPSQHISTSETMWDGFERRKRKIITIMAYYLILKRQISEILIVHTLCRTSRCRSSQHLSISDSHEDVWHWHTQKHIGLKYKLIWSKNLN